jgi:hypothetical protein
MMGGKPVNAKVSPSTLRTMLANDESPLFGVSKKCQYAPVPGQPTAGPAVALCNGRLLAGNVVWLAEAAWDCIATVHPTTEPPTIEPKPTRVSAPRSRRRHDRRAMWRPRRAISRSTPSVEDLPVVQPISNSPSVEPEETQTMPGVSSGSTCAI